MPNLVEHCEREIRAAGLDSGTADYEGLIATSLRALVAAFSGQGHSGESAAMTLNLFDRLVNYKPISPLLGTPDEWQDMSSYDSSPPGTLFQNVRCSSVFKRGDKVYDVGMKTVYVRQDGSSFTVSDEEPPLVCFPYSPGFPPFVRVDADGMIV